MLIFFCTKLPFKRYSIFETPFSDKDDEEPLPDNDDIKRNLSLDLEETKVEPPTDHVVEPVCPKEEDDGECMYRESIDFSVNKLSVA